MTAASAHPQIIKFNASRRWQCTSWFCASNKRGADARRAECRAARGEEGFRESDVERRRFAPPSPGTRPGDPARTPGLFVSALAFFQKLPPCLVGIEACASLAFAYPARHNLIHGSCTVAIHLPDDDARRPDDEQPQNCSVAPDRASSTSLSVKVATYRTAIGDTVEPLAPCSFSGWSMNANSNAPFAASSSSLRFSRKWMPLTTCAN
jgi:hypothetical protein